MLIQAIRFFLEKDKKVVIPELGSFSESTRELHFDAETSAFVPRMQEVVFDESERHSFSDFFLRAAIEFAVTEEQLKSEVEKLIANLRFEITENGRFELEDLGVFTVNEDYSLQFEGKKWTSEVSDLLEDEFVFPVIDRENESLGQPEEAAPGVEDWEASLPDERDLELENLISALDLNETITISDDIETADSELIESNDLPTSEGFEIASHLLEDDSQSDESAAQEIHEVRETENLLAIQDNPSEGVVISEPIITSEEKTAESPLSEDEPKRLSVGKILVIILIPIVACLLAFTYIKKYSPNRSTEILSQSERASDIPPVSKLPEVEPPAVPIDEEPLKAEPNPNSKLEVEKEPASSVKDNPQDNAKPSTKQEKETEATTPKKSQPAKEKPAYNLSSGSKKVIDQPKANAAVSGAYMISVGSFGVEANANKLAAELKGKGYEVSVIPPSNGKKLFKVGIGSFGSSAEAKDYMKKIQPDFKENLFVMK